MLHHHQGSFLLHAIIETVASANFLVFPDSQLPRAAPQAHAVIRQYGILLLCSVLISVLMALEPLNVLSGKMAGALALYHVGPITRAASRTFTRAESMQRTSITQPLFYLFIHSVCLATLGLTSWDLFISHYVQRF